jgi:hypothetical protein
MILDVVRMDFAMRRMFDSVRKVKWSPERIEYVITQNEKRVRVWFKMDPYRREFEPGELIDWGIENIDMDDETLGTVEDAINSLIFQTVWRL